MRNVLIACIALAVSVEESLRTTADKLNDVRTAGAEALLGHLAAEGGGGDVEQQQQQPAPPPVLPVPFAGETSDDYADRYPDALVCSVPTGLKYDPWHVIEQDGVFTRGAWIPLDAPFTAPVA